MTSKQRVLSGMQPTGYLHLGHYLGVLKNYVKMQDEMDCYYMIANWHSLTSYYQDYKSAHSFIFYLLSDWLAAGIDPNKSTIFLQSSVKEHAELNLILSMFTPVSWLLRNPTYKEKMNNIEKDIDSLGFLGYPVLQAADILIYKANKVPIGEDQLPHLELTREIARRVNHILGKNILVEPSAYLSKFPKVLGLDGRKMSKSYNNTLVLNDDSDTILKKLKRMKTDTKRIKKDDPGEPNDCPVFTYYDFFSVSNKEEIASRCRKATIGCIDCKKNIGFSMVEELSVFNEKKNYYLDHKDDLRDILNEGKKVATKVASESLQELKSLIGLKDNIV